MIVAVVSVRPALLACSTVLCPAPTPVTPNCTDRLPCGTVTVAGAVATDALSVDRLTVSPPAGAACDNVSVIGAVVFWTTDNGFGVNAAVSATVANVDSAIAGLPPDAQAELAQLFALLAFGPARLAIG